MNRSPDLSITQETNPMTDNLPDHDLTGRLNLIESMIAEGRRTSQQWAWAYLLWGAAYYVAIAWSIWGKSWMAWPVTMLAAAVFTAIVSSRIRRNAPATSIGRALGALWSVMGTVLFLLLISLSVSGRGEIHLIVAFAAAMLAVANGISSAILRWKMQFACAVVWLACAIGACFADETQLAVLSLAAIFLCQIVFGIYGMVLEGRRRSRGVAHA